MWRSLSAIVLEATLLLSVVAGCANHREAGTAAAQTPDEADSTGWLTYDCTGGGVVRARYLGPDAAQVEARGRLHEMKRATSASGARHVGGGLEWWTQGSGTGASGLLLAHRGDDDRVGERLDSCSRR